MSKYFFGRQTFLCARNIPAANVFGKTQQTGKNRPRRRTNSQRVEKLEIVDTKRMSS